MKIWAKLKFDGEKNADYLIRHFSKNLTPKAVL